MEQSEMPERVFRKTLYAHDASDPAFDTFKLALAITKQNDGDLHIVSVAEIEHVPQFITDVREQEIIVGRRVHRFLFYARAMAAQNNVILHNHILVGHPVRDIVRLACEIESDLLIIGAGAHSSIYERVVTSRASQIVRLAHCPVLVVKGRYERPPGGESIWNRLLWAAGLRHEPEQSSALTGIHIQLRKDLPVYAGRNSVGA